MKKLHYIFCLLFIFLQRTAAQTPTYHVQVINQNGMTAPGDILQLLKDDKGFLWILSPTKVQRYNGKNFLTFSFDERCLNIQQDDEGIIWLASRQSLYQYKNEYTGFEKLTAYAADSVLYLNMHAGPQKKIYLLTRKNILQWNDEKKQFDSLRVKLSTTNNSFSFLKSKGNYLFYKKNETVLARYHVVTGIEEELAVANSNYACPVNDDTLWVRQGIGGSVLASFTAKTVTPITRVQFAEKFNDNRFFVTGSSSNFSFVCLNNNGYHSYNPATNKFSRVKLLNNGLPLGGSPPINSFYEEENGNIWYATQEGLVHFDPRKNAIGLIRSNAAAGEDWNNNVRNIAEDKDGNTWFATANGFCRLDKKTGAIKTWLPKFEADNYLNYPSVRSIGYSNGNIIVGQSEKGFWIFNPQNNTFRRPEYENDSIQRVFEDGFNSNMIQLRNGNFLIFSRRVWQMDKESYKVREVKFDGFKPVPRNAYEDALGRIWFAGSGGVFCTGDDFKLLYSLSNPEINRWANTIVQINENTFWMGAKHLFEIKLRPGGKMELKPLFTELKSIHFSHLYKDSLFRIWMYSDNGIYRYLPEEKVLEKFDRSDNAQAYNASISNSVRSRDGMLYAGSVNGINYFVPEKIPLQNDSLHVQLTNIIVNGDDSTFLLNRTLPMLKYLQNSLVFDFTAPYIYNGEKVQYRCRLQDTDKDWTYLGNENGIRYTSLKPGNYVFNIAASLNGKDWYENEKPFSFSIAPPFWQTWWFRLLLLFATILSIYKFIGWRGKQIAKREAHKTEVEKLKSINLQNQLEIEQVLNYFATSIGSQTNIDDMLWDVAKNCISKLGFEDCIIYLIDKERNVLIQKAAWGPKTNEQNKIIRPIEIDFGKGIVGAVAVSGKAEIIADTTLDERYIIDDASRLSEIAVPILEADKVIGVIDSEHSQKKFYTKQHLHILSTIAAMLSDSIEKIQAGQQAREKEIEVLQLNKDLSDWRVAALRAQMNPHFIFNSLNSISQLVASKQNEEGLQYLSKFSKLLRMVLDESEKSFISIKDEIKMLDLYLQLETLRFGNSFSYTIHADDTLDEEETLLPSFLIHPIIENAIWHGLLHKEGERRLIIRFIKKDKDKLICIVKDNGIGIEAATLKKRQQLNGEKQESKGLKMVKERLGLLEDQNHSSTSFKMEDMKDDNGYVSGTKCTLELPVIYE